MEAITKRNKPKNEKELKSFKGALHYLSAYVEKLSDILRQLAEKPNKWIRTDEYTMALNFLKSLIDTTAMPRRNQRIKEESKNGTILTTDAGTKGLGQHYDKTQKRETKTDWICKKFIGHQKKTS